MYRLLALLGLLGICGCPGQSDEQVVLGSCIEQPTELPRPPGTTLPCELIPPGLKLGGAAQ